jgi:hypothetical protein
VIGHLHAHDDGSLPAGFTFTFRVEKRVTQKGSTILGCSISQHFVDLVISIAVPLERRLFGFMASPFFTWLAGMLQLPNRYVSLTILALLLREDMATFVRQQSAAIIHRCYDVLDQLAHTHWHDEVRPRAGAVIGLLARYNQSELAQAMKGKRAEPRGRTRARRSWQLVIAAVDWEQMAASQEKVEEEVAALPFTEISVKARFMPSPVDPAAKELYREMRTKLEEIAPNRKISVDE